MQVFHFGVYEPSNSGYCGTDIATRQETNRTGCYVAECFVGTCIWWLTEAGPGKREEYTLKKIEAFYGFKRKRSSRRVRQDMRTFEHRLIADGGWGDASSNFARKHRDAKWRDTRGSMPADTAAWTCDGGV